MKIIEAMSERVEYVNPKMSLHEVAKRMAELNCGFLPVSNESGSRLEGVITDRDIAIRAVAEGMNPDTTTAGEVMSRSVLYCYAGDDLEIAANSMRDQGVYRLIVLNNSTEKKLCGILSLGDIIRHNEDTLAATVAKDISKKVA